MSSKLVRALAVVLSAGAGVAIGVILHMKQPWLLLLPPHEAPLAAESRPNATAAPSAVGSAGPTSASASASVATSASSSSNAGAPTGSDAPSTAAKAEGPDACLRTLFAEDTFEAPEPGLAKLCEDKSASKFSKRVKSLLVGASHGRMTGGMKEWGMLGIYELAAMAAMRGHCCPDAPEVEVAGPPGTCPPLSDSLGAIAKAARAGAAPNDLDAAVATFDKDVRCVIRSEQTQAFGDYGPLGGGEGTTLAKTIARIKSLGTSR